MRPILRRMTGRALALALALAITPSPAGAAAVTSLSLAEENAMRTALMAAQIGGWTRAFELMAPVDNPVAHKLMQWMYVADPDSGATFARITGFQDANPAWPLQDTLRRNAEDALAAEPIGPRTIPWFTQHPPRTGAGMVRFAQALAAQGRASEAVEWARKAWTTSALPKDAEHAVQTQWGRLLTPQDHEKRLDALLWLGRPNEARKMMSRIPLNRRTGAEARIALATQAPGVDGAVNRVPPDQLKEPNLVYERVRWRRRNGNTQGAIDLLAPVPAQATHEDAWWAEREVLARRALDSGRVTDAYKIAAAHGQTDRADIAEAEWLAGWIALQFLNEPAQAYQHFLREYEQVRMPVSRARAAYWLARAAERRKDLSLAERWRREAASFETTFYGQLAMEKLGGRPTIRLPTEPVPSPEEGQAFLSQELAQAALLLAQVGETTRLRPFFIRLADTAATPAEQALVAELAARIGRTDLAVATAKLASVNGTLLAYAGYPTLDAPAVAGVEPALVLALIRQESEFYPTARSRAGALGLMQLMPATARRVAVAQKVNYELSLLTQDPAYNLNLGTAHLASLLDTFRGSYVLSLAAYNAGEARARQWIRAYGDPRDPAVDIVDWIEQIPLEETRNYVQRVMENLLVYRARLSGAATPVTLTKELRR